jgi:biopolymer transport protein TolR
VLKRPSSRRKSNTEPIQLNLIPMLDALVTLIGFLLFTTSFLAIVHIESPFPVTSARDVEEKLKARPLQLTVTLRENEIEIWSPFDRIPAKTIPLDADGQLDFKSMHDSLITVKQQFPLETKVVIVPHAGVSYDILIAAMDGMRSLEPTDPPIFAKNESTGIDEAIKLLFPDVIFGNLLGDG